MTKMNWTKIQQENLISRRGGVEKLSSAELKAPPSKCTSKKKNGEACKNLVQKGYNKCGPHLDKSSTSNVVKVGTGQEANTLR